MVLNFKCIVQNTRLPRLDVVADPPIQSRPFLNVSLWKHSTASWVATACDGVQSRAKPFMMGYNRAD